MNVASAPRLRSVSPHYADPDVNDDPHPFYAELRRNAPICLTSDVQFRGRQGYMLTRYEDVKLVVTDRRFSSNPQTIGGEASGGGLGGLLRRVQMFRVLMDSMAFKDDPDHKRLRGLVNQAFTNRAVQTLEQDVQQTVDRLCDDIAARGTVDFVEDFAVVLPLAVISQMLGIEARDRDQFYAWMRKLTSGADSGALGLILAMPTGRRMLKMFKRLVAERREAPDGKLISSIVQARHEGDRLDDQEVLAMIFLLLLAGHDTTANLINMSALAFIDHPEWLARLRSDPQLIGPAVEELLRFTTPVTAPAPRIPIEDVEIGGVAIPKGSPILAMIISANRDEAVFANPDTLDLARDPNRHLSFGFGHHFCLGSMLARLEARVALTTVVQRFGHMELAVPRDQLRYKPSNLRGLASLPISVSEFGQS